MSTPAPSSVALQPVELSVDVAIIGAGAAGCAAAAAVATSGRSVALIDLHARAANEFRAEKVGQRQLDYLEAFGISQAVREALTPYDGAWIHRYGRIIDYKTTPEFGMAYGQFINAMRDGLPPDVNFIVGRIDDVETSAELQHLTLANGRRVTARLLVIATGLGDVVRRKLGIEKGVASAGHSLSFGFDLKGTRADFPFPSLVWYLDRPMDEGAYLSVFPIGDRFRANLFTYRRMADRWVKDFRIEPTRALHALLPGLDRFGRFEIDGAVVARPIDLVDAVNYRQPGIVLLGDAFSTACPATGTGVNKAFGDVDVLINRHLPNWLATPGMGIEKVTQFYADPAKLERDAAARRSSLRMRSARMDRGPIGIAQRIKHQVVTRAEYEWRALSRSLSGSHATTRWQPPRPSAPHGEAPVRPL